jgi:hypothetical protein
MSVAAGRSDSGSLWKIAPTSPWRIVRGDFHSPALYSAFRVGRRRMSYIEFTSDQFRPFLPDDRQVNPNVLGFELAAWLARELAAVGIVTSYPQSEDWGWYLDYTLNGVRCMICCGNQSSVDPDDDRTWQIHLDRFYGLFRRPKPIPGEDELLNVIAQRLEKAGIAASIVADP